MSGGQYMTLKSQFLDVLSRLHTNKTVNASDRKELEQFTSLVEQRSIENTDYAKIFVYSLLLFCKFEKQVKDDKLFQELCKNVIINLGKNLKKLTPNQALEKTTKPSRGRGFSKPE